MKNKSRSGFTLIELLAIIIVLTLIMLVIVPSVVKAINNAQRGVFENSIHSLMKVAENECLLNQNEAFSGVIRYSFTNGVQTVEPIEFAPLKFKGRTPKGGYVEVSDNCDVEIAVNDGKYYIETDINGALKKAIVYVPPYDGPWIFEATTMFPSETFTFGVADANLVIDWGDGNNDTYTYSGQNYISHEYDAAGVYEVTVTGTATHITFCSFDSFVCTATNLAITNILTPISSSFGLTSAAYMFNATEIESFIEPSFFDEASSSISDFSYMFSYSSFNQNISNWDTSNATNMSGMFYSNAWFNQDITEWNTSVVNDMSFMFCLNNSFNQNIGEWDTSSVTTMEGMFCENRDFNQNIGNWDTSSVTNMRVMFFDATSFNQNLSGWCTTSLITSPPNSFDVGATAWVLPKPVWGTCP